MADVSGTLTLTVRLNAKGARTLQRAPDNRTLRLQVSFTPTNGTRRTVASGPFRVPARRS